MRKSVNGRRVERYRGLENTRSMSVWVIMRLMRVQEQQRKTSAEEMDCGEGDPLTAVAINR